MGFYMKYMYSYYTGIITSLFTNIGLRSKGGEQKGINLSGTVY